jgi:hypothetical protein
MIYWFFVCLMTLSRLHPIVTLNGSCLWTGNDTKQVVAYFWHYSTICLKGLDNRRELWPLGLDVGLAWRICDYQHLGYVSSDIPANRLRTCHEVKARTATCVLPTTSSSSANVNVTQMTNVFYITRRLASMCARSRHNLSVLVTVTVPGVNIWIRVSKLTNSVAQEPEGSSPHSQQPATGPCPETVESNPHPPKPISLRVNIWIRVSK